MAVVHYYKQPGLSPGAKIRKLKELKSISSLVADLNTEICFNIKIDGSLSSPETEKLCWILSSPLHPGNLKTEPSLQGVKYGSVLIEIGPR